MRLVARITPRRLTLPGRTVRLRLTLLYGSLFLLSGICLLTITYLLFRHSTGHAIFYGSTSTPRTSPTVHFPPSPQQLAQLQAQADQTRVNAIHQHTADLHQLLIQSGIALAVMTVLALGLGWFVAGRVLRPLRKMTATTRQISTDNLDQRLALDGPRDEVKDLADTIDELLARLHTAFDAQRRFVANASHELRTPLTLERALIEESLTDRHPTVRSFRSTSTRLLAITEQQERLLEALLTLATGEQGLDRQEQFDLGHLTEQLLRTPRPDGDKLNVDIGATIAPAPIKGDRRLVERLISNLVDNAVRHNIPGGRVRIATGTGDGHAFITVSNSGPVIPHSEIDRLFEPFQRLDTDRSARTDSHHGLGLSIVRAIANAHNAKLTPHARTDGGLDIEITFPAAGASREHKHQPSAVASRSHGATLVSSERRVAGSGGSDRP
jgi:signal transduction histidine kinase